MEAIPSAQTITQGYQIQARGSEFGDRLSNGMAQGWYLFFADFQNRYRLTFFGYWWSIVKPLAGSLPLIIVGKQFDFAPGLGHVPYELYAIVGVIFWSLFWDSVTYPLFFARRTRKILYNMNLSAGALIFATLSAVLFQFILGLVVIIGAFAIWHVPVMPTVIVSILCLPILVLAGLSLGLPLLCFSLVYQDVNHGIGYLGTALLWTAPVIHQMPEGGLIAAINAVNPLTYILSVPRDLIFSTSTPFVSEFGLASLAVTFCFGLSFFFYRRVIRMALDYVI